MYSEDIKNAWGKIRIPDLERVATAMLLADVKCHARAADNGDTVIIRVGFACDAPAETARYSGDVPEIIPYMLSHSTLFEDLVSNKRFSVFPPLDCARDTEFVARVEYSVPSLSAFLAGGNRKQFMKRLAVHEVANVFADALQFYNRGLTSRLLAKFPDPRRYLDALVRRKTGFGDVARVYHRPQKPVLRNRRYFDR